MVKKFIDKIHVYADGGCKPNPGIMVGAFLITDGKQILTGPEGKIFKEGTNVLAEFKAISLALNRAVEFTRKEVFIFCDNKFVIEALRKEKRIHKDHLKQAVVEIYKLAELFEKVEFLHVSENNEFIKKCDKKCQELLSQIGKV